MVGEQDLRVYLDKWDKKYWSTYKVLDILQKVFYRSNPAREAFVEMCESDYVQKMTFDSYLYKTVVPGNPLDDAKLLVQVGHASPELSACLMPQIYQTKSSCVVTYSLPCDLTVVVCRLSEACCVATH